MRVSSVSSTSLLFAAAAYAQNLSSITQALSSLNLTSLLSAFDTINGTSVGQSLLSQLGASPQTIFAPTDAGFAGAKTNFSSDPDLLANVISYHVLPGTFNDTQTFPNTTVGRTLLDRNSSLVFLEGDKNQVLAWSSVNGTLQVLNQDTEVPVVNSTTVGNLTINVIDAVLEVPGEFTSALERYNLTSLSAALTQADLLDTLNYVHGFTLFAPSNDAFAAAQSALADASSNATLLSTILLNHVVNGESVYSGDLQNGAMSATGGTFAAIFNETGNFVMSGNTTAQIVTPDVLLWNGVIHIIDQVFEASESGVASSE